jgi:hypothetical protein
MVLFYVVIRNIINYIDAVKMTRSNDNFFFFCVIYIYENIYYRSPCYTKNKKEDYWDLVSCGNLIKRVIQFEIKHEIRSSNFLIFYNYMVTYLNRSQQDSFF